ncbi:MAG: LacI family DNA-binding transcriptional regulator [Gammaproteobacteria bacterium]|nr:LacI family DNA-binding transcriptional regulator [Gammaproteobacteria bacterium]NVK88411.1 LacI family DNA-binding transcriptional regulator [Gammaproteobacteria bacterium]
MATIKDVSDLAGVSQATVSRVLNGTTRVDDDKKRRVLEAIKQLGYRPNAHAKSLASNRSNSIGMVVSELAGPYFGEMMAGAEAIIRRNDKQMLIASSHASESEEREVIDFLLSCRCDALILHAETLSDAELVKIHQQGTVLVLLNRYIPAIAEQCFVLDNELGGFIQTEHMIQQGRRRVACILGPQWKHDAKERFEGYLRALKQYQLPFDPELVVEGDFQESGGYAGVKKLIARGARFDALVCANDEMALGAMDALSEQGVAIPEQVAVIGFDDIAYANYVTPKLSSIHFPVRQIAADAAWLVMQSVYKMEPPEEIVQQVMPKLVTRQSSNCG